MQKKIRNNNIMSVLLVAALLMLAAPAMAEPQTPFVLNGYVTDSNGEPCNDPWVQVTNLNSSVSWDVENFSTSNYYQLVLDSDDVNASEILRFDASGCSQAKITEHTVTQDEIGGGGLFAFNIMTESDYTLTMAVDGSGTTDPSTGTHSYPAETVVDVSATPDTGWQFNDWSGDLSGSVNPTTITMDSDKSVTAHFSENLVYYTLTMAVDGSGTTDPSTGTHSYPAETVVDVSATPDTGWQFNDWSGDLTGSVNPTTITMDSDKSVTAHFSENLVYYTLTMAVDGSGTTDPSTGTHSYPAETVVDVSATPDTGWQFNDWSGDLTGSVNPTTITMDSDKSVTAHFSENPVIITYDFTIGAGIDKWAYRYQTDAKLPAVNDVPGIEFVTATKPNKDQYAKISTDDRKMQRDSTDAVGNYSAHRFVFDIMQPVDILTIEVLWSGKGTYADRKKSGATLYIRNCTSGAYEELANTTSNKKVYLTAEMTAEIGSYVDATGNMTVLVEQNSAHAVNGKRSLVSKLSTDYVKVDITHT